MSDLPNIILMVSDDHGKEALGCYGNPVIQTPHLDALAETGVRFTNSFCTTASCAASRSVILTGLHNHTNGTFGHTHACHHFSCYDDVKTLPAILGARGYRRGRVGKRHYAPSRIFPFDWEGPEGAVGRNDVNMAEVCTDFIEGDDPFFLYWCSFNPHRAGFVENHPLRPNSFGNPERAFPGDEEQIYREEDVIVPHFLSDTPETRAELAQYYQSISRLDRGVGRLMESLKSAGKEKDTIIIYISDNGAAFPGAKTTLYEPGMNLPCIVRDPLEPTVNQVCDGLITWADITPTILDYAGVTHEEGDFHGRSFRGILGEEAPQGWREEAYAAHTFHEITNYYPMRVIRTERYKFIWNIAYKLDYSFASDLWAAPSWQGVINGGMTHLGSRTTDAYIHRSAFELYDLEKDPEELVNLADRGDHAGLVDRFKDKLRKFQKETADPWLHKWEYE